MPWNRPSSGRGSGRHGAWNSRSSARSYRSWKSSTAPSLTCWNSCAISSARVGAVAGRAMPTAPKACRAAADTSRPAGPGRSGVRVDRPARMPGAWPGRSRPISSQASRSAPAQARYSSSGSRSATGHWWLSRCGSVSSRAGVQPSASAVRRTGCQCASAGVSQPIRRPPTANPSASPVSTVSPAPPTRTRPRVGRWTAPERTGSASSKLRPARSAAAAASSAIPPRSAPGSPCRQRTAQARVYGWASTASSAAVSAPSSEVTSGQAGEAVPTAATSRRVSPSWARAKARTVSAPPCPAASSSS